MDSYPLLKIWRKTRQLKKTPRTEEEIKEKGME
jgi:hypothetical protein